MPSGHGVNNGISEEINSNYSDLICYPVDIIKFGIAHLIVVECTS